MRIACNADSSNRAVDFAAGSPHWGTLIALEIDGRPAGRIHDGRPLGSRGACADRRGSRGRFTDLNGRYDLTSGTAVFSNGLLHEDLLKLVSDVWTS